MAAMRGERAWRGASISFHGVEQAQVAVEGARPGGSSSSGCEPAQVGCREEVALGASMRRWWSTEWRRFLMRVRSETEVGALGARWRRIAGAVIGDPDARQIVAA